MLQQAEQPISIRNPWILGDIRALSEELVYRALHIGVGEAGEGVQAAVLGYVGGDVEAAGQVVDVVLST